MIRSAVLIQSTRVTDGQTELGIAIAYAVAHKNPVQQSTGILVTDSCYIPSSISVWLAGVMA